MDNSTMIDSTPKFFQTIILNPYFCSIFAVVFMFVSIYLFCIRDQDHKKYDDEEQHEEIHQRAPKNAFQSSDPPANDICITFDENGNDVNDEYIILDDFCRRSGFKDCDQADDNFKKCRIENTMFYYCNEKERDRS